MASLRMVALATAARGVGPGASPGDGPDPSARTATPPLRPRRRVGRVHEPRTLITRTTLYDSARLWAAN